MKAKYLLSLLAVLLVPLALPVSSAFACGRAIKHKVDPDVRLLSEADSQLRAGKYRETIRLLGETYAHIRHEYPSKETRLTSLERRAARILTIATVRSTGKFTIDMDASPVTSKPNRQSNLQWAHDLLDSMRQTPGAGTTLDRYYAEALAAVGGHDQKAYAILKNLDSKGMLYGGHSYALLSKLARKLGDEGLAETAAEKCAKQFVPGFSKHKVKCPKVEADST